MPIIPFTEIIDSAGAGGVVAQPQFWAGSPAYEGWLANFHADLVAVAAAANPSGLDGWGWTCTGLAVVEGSAGDFMSSADNDPTHVRLADANDVLSSPRIFGGFDAVKMVTTILGSVPTKFMLEFYASFPVNGTNQTTTFIGLTAPATTDAAAAGSAGAITSNGTNFVLTSDTGSDAGAALDTAWHMFRIEWTFASTVEWFIDDVSQGTIAMETDIWPQAFKAMSQLNDIYLAFIHWKYS